MNKEDIKRRGLIFTGRYLPYNPKLKERARELRKRMTPAEKKLWKDFLRTFRFRVLPQRPIDNYIVDFYCPSLKLVIEIDGDHHCTEEGKEYDSERDAVLQSYGLNVIRISNSDITDRFEDVCSKIQDLIPPAQGKKKPTS
ncbi:MAG: endonuclease domain-containing protein [Candidatus Latescibacteria bacterium]|nr:endonuclease domain-containing protein [Candidatus Latescibacterota bacterium]